MPTWTVAGVQMDCALGDLAANRAAVVAKLRQGADRGAKLAVFPECILTGYGFDSREQVRAVAEPLPGPSTDFVASACAVARTGITLRFVPACATVQFNFNPLSFCDRSFS